MHPRAIELRVFVDESGAYGNPLGLVEDSGELSDHRCQQIARRLGHSETVFVDNAATGRVRIFSPVHRMPFAGHPAVGAGWWLNRHGPRAELHVDAGRVLLSATARGCTLEAPASWSRPWRLVRVPGMTELMTADSSGSHRHDYVWAWLDEGAGLVRARAFTSASGVPEDEATGSAAMCLAERLGRAITIRQGVGSLLHAEPTGVGTVLLTGAVSVVPVRR